jgi:hypothetical protein
VGKTQGLKVLLIRWVAMKAFKFDEIPLLAVSRKP